MLRGEAYTTEAREEALADAERRLIREGHTPTIFLRPKQIKTMPELFQPRMFSYDGRATDEKHVKELVDGIKTDGKIEPPPLVIKLKHKGFVIVDGHHTLAAYKKVKENEQIECEWFKGTVRQAWDEAVRRNRKDKLPMHKHDKTHAAWERVLIGGWTAQQIKDATGKSVRTVRTMNKVKKAACRGGKFQRALIENVTGMETEVTDDREEAALACLKRISWTRARLLYAGVDAQEATEEEKAERLARKLGGNIPDKLMLEPRVIALALKLYRSELPEQLKDAWEDLKNHPEVLRKAKEVQRRVAERNQERANKMAEVIALKAAAAKRHQEGMERLQRLEEEAKARAAPKSTTAAQEDPRTRQGGDGGLQGQAEASGPPGA
jgi:hypothetical protein